MRAKYRQQIAAMEAAIRRSENQHYDLIGAVHELATLVGVRIVYQPSPVAPPKYTLTKIKIEQAPASAPTLRTRTRKRSP